MVQGLTQAVVSDQEGINRLMDQGQKMRTVGATAMNETSSRSHSIFTIVVEINDVDEAGKDHIRVGKASKQKNSGLLVIFHVPKELASSWSAMQLCRLGMYVHAKGCLKTHVRSSGPFLRGAGKDGTAMFTSCRYVSAYRTPSVHRVHESFPHLTLFYVSRAAYLLTSS